MIGWRWGWGCSKGDDNCLSVAPPRVQYAMYYVCVLVFIHIYIYVYIYFYVHTYIRIFLAGLMLFLGFILFVLSFSGWHKWETEEGEVASGGRYWGVIFVGAAIWRWLCEVNITADMKFSIFTVAFAVANVCNSRTHTHPHSWDGERQ